MRCNEMISQKITFSDGNNYWALLLMLPTALTIYSDITFGGIIMNLFIKKHGTIFKFAKWTSQQKCCIKKGCHHFELHPKSWTQNFWGVFLWKKGKTGSMGLLRS
jgi:hypothetical protein